MQQQLNFMIVSGFKRNNTSQPQIRMPREHPQSNTPSSKKNIPVRTQLHDPSVSWSPAVRDVPMRSAGGSSYHALPRSHQGICQCPRGCLSSVAQPIIEKATHQIRQLRMTNEVVSPKGPLIQPLGKLGAIIPSIVWYFGGPNC